jgi:hypothetical protein
LQIPKGGKVKDGQTQSSGSGWKSKNIKMVIVINCSIEQNQEDHDA